jgi:hypothetical protein
MKNATPLLLLLLVAPMAASAAEIRSTIVDSVQLTVDAPGVQSTRIGSQYTVSGSNISVTTLGGLTGSSASAPATISAGSYDVGTDEQAFTFSESQIVGDVAVTSQSSLSSGGRVETPNIYGSSMQYQGGTPGSLAGTLSPTGIPTVTAGGSGTSAIGQRTVELTVFN